MRLTLKTVYVAAMGLFFVCPTVVVILISFESSNILYFPPPGFSVKWYVNFWQSPEWRGAAATSLKVAVASMALATLLGVLLALGFERARGRAWTLLNAAAMSPLIVPYVISGLGMYVFFLKIGVIHGIGTFIVAHTVLGLPFVTVMVTASLRSLDPNLELAARSLGAGPTRTFVRITLPLIVPSVTAGALFAFITSWDEVVVALYLATPTVKTLPVEMWSGVRFGVDPTVAAAASMVTVVSLMSLGALMVARSLAKARPLEEIL